MLVFASIIIACICVVGILVLGEPWMFAALVVAIIGLIAFSAAKGFFVGIKDSVQIIKGDDPFAEELIEEFSPAEACARYGSNFRPDDLSAMLQEDVDAMKSNEADAGSAVDRYCEVLEILLHRPIAIDREMRECGAEIKKFGRRQQLAARRLRTKMMMFFGYLYEGGYDGWTNDKRTMQDIEDLYKDQKELAESIQKSRKIMENQVCGGRVDTVSFLAAKRQAVADIDFAIACMQQVICDFQAVFDEYRKLKQQA